MPGYAHAEFPDHLMRPGHRLLEVAGNAGCRNAELKFFRGISGQGNLYLGKGVVEISSDKLLPWLMMHDAQRTFRGMIDALNTSS